MLLAFYVVQICSEEHIRASLYTFSISSAAASCSDLKQNGVAGNWQPTNT